MYFQQVNITGMWAEEKKTGGFQFSAHDGDNEMDSRWRSFGNVDVKVARGRTQQGVRYLNFYTMHLGHVGFPIGGLLGEDDHSLEASRPSSCEKKTFLRIDGDPDSATLRRPRSFAEASLA